MKSGMGDILVLAAEPDSPGQKIVETEDRKQANV